MSSQQEVPLYCVICSKQFSGALSAQQHFISEAHRKKEDQIKNSVFQGNTRTYWCDPCNVQCNTAEQFQQHIVSPRHKEIVRRSLGFAYQAATPVQNPLLSGRVQHVGSSPTQGLNQTVPFKMSSETARKEYDFNGSRGYCHLCDIDLTSPQHARQHLSGSKHQKKQKQMEAGEDNTNVLKCQICNVPFTSLGNAQEHLASAKHLKKKREMEGQDNVFNSSSPLYGVSNISQPSNAPTRLGISPSETGTGLFADVPVYSNSSSMPETRPSQTMAPLLTTSSTLVGNMSVSDTVKTSSGDGNEYNVPYTFDGKEGYCNVCHVDFTSPQNAQQHLDGSRHKKAEKQWKLGQSASEVLKCDLCNVVFSGPESAQQHFDSDRHKKRSQLPKTNFTLQEQEKPQLSQKMTLVNNPLATPGATVQTCLPMNIQPESNSLTEPKVSQFPKAPSLAQIMLPNENKLTYSAGPTGYLPLTVSNQNEGSLCLSVHGGTLTDVPILGSYSCLQNLNMVNQHFPHITDGNNSNNSSENTQMQRTPLSQENVTEEQEYIFYGSTGRCNICKIELTSREHANQHLSGKKHAKAKGLHSAGTGDVLVNNGPDVSERTAGVKPSTSPQTPYRFDGNRGWCNVCSIELTSSQHAQQHLNGKNHTNALARWQATNRHEESKESAERRLYEFDGMRGFCNVCNIELTSKAHASQHLAGKPHEKAVQRLNLVDAVDAHRDPSSGVSQPGDAMEEPAYVFTGGRGRCFVCNIELTSPQHATQHLQGRSHARAEEKRKMINQNGILSLQCKVCLKSFSGQESAAQHYASAKHISKAGLTKGSLDPVGIEAGGLYSAGRENSVGHSPRNMYVCEVCQCQVNSFEQLSIHKKSPKHLQTVEKKQRYVAVALSAYGDENSRGSSVEDSQDKTESKQGSYKDVWEALRTGEVTAVKGITPNTEVKEIISSISRSVPITTASNVSSDLVGHWEHLDTDGRQSTRVSEAGSGVRKLSSTNSASKTLSTERERSPGMSAAAEETVSKDNRINTEITPSRNVIFKSTSLAKLVMGRGSTIVNPTITTTDAMPLRMRTAAITQPTSTDVGDTDDFQDNVKGSGGSRRPSTHNPLKNQTTVRHRGNKVPLDVFENLNSDEEESSRSKTLPLDDDLPGGEADSLISYNTNASSILNDGPHVSMGSSTTDHNHSIAPRQDRNISLLTDAESSICPSSNFELLIGHVGIGAIPKVPPKNPFGGYYKFYCDICNRPMNTDKDYQAHLQSRAHQQQAAEVEAPRVNLGQIQRVLSIDDAEEAAYHVTNTMPRSYQVDLFCKTMEGDKVIFLPTGTGKTLVSVMTLSCMLQRNPRRPVLFLVDKVLLVLQQSKYITNELGNRKYKRMTSDGEEQERELKIATLCGNILPQGTTPLYKHDVIVSTAAYADNLLLKQQLRWEDFSLVVFDEAHHCVKNHPFNRLLEAYHRPCQPEHRPKVLGLTASPAGRDSVESTVSMLHELFHNLGGASIAIVQGDCVGELKRYQSSAKLKINYEPFSDEERAFRKTLLVYICQCYLKLSELCTIDTDCHFGVEKMQGEDLEDFVEHLDNAATERFVRALGNCQAKSQQPQVKMNMDFLVNHCKILLIALSDLDSVGIPTAVADLQTFNQTPAQSGFQHAQGMGIQCEKLQDAMRRAAHSAHVQQEFDDNPLHITLYTQLLTTLTNDKYINWKAGRNAMALILVRERAHAHRLSNFLKQTQFASANSLKITSVVGHGSGQADGGMKVKQQKKVLDGVKSKKYNIIVATSVAEEGVDIPECELVVCMNPPNTVTTLVQMRGRARKKDSHFVILCKSSDEKDKIQNILRREQFMMKAAEHCVQE
ncbi:uncharacterized protein [Haliotis cracherodii]|uniref:uncharacterized protein n=1 Tax=Haliotis cracherodii TaxID=6455 RepID=UPI0039EBDAD2